MNSAQPLTSALCTDDKRIQRADCAIRTRMLFADIDVHAAAKLLEPITNIQFRANETLHPQGKTLTRFIPFAADWSSCLLSPRTVICALCAYSVRARR